MELLLRADLCCGHGRCYTILPQLFEADDEGFAGPADRPVEVPEELSMLARRTVAACPERAIELREE
jgi:ferredoxin